MSTRKPKGGSKARRRVESLPQYDFSRGVRGKYAKRYAEGTNIVALAPDVARALPTADAVNAALRGLMEIADRTVQAR
jgi:hypothetical protein